MGEITGTGQAVSGLGGAAGYGETAIARADESVTRLDVSAVFEAGFTLGGVSYAAQDLFISTDGLISFGAGVGGVQSSLSAITAPFFAIFQADVDTRLDGEGAESGGIWVDVDPVADCVTITWDQVGFYRRNASLVNTFQLQLFDRGNGGFQVVFRYQDIAWTSGDVQGGFGGLGGLAALIGLRGAASGEALALPASGQETALLALATTLGNSGVAGLWVWDFLQPSVITGSALADVLAGTAYDDAQNGLAGNDRLLGSAGADSLNGGSGLDRADYGAAEAAVWIDLATPANNLGQARGDVYAGIEVFLGSAFDDTMAGAAGDDTFLGLAGRDLLQGGAGNDRLSGGGGGDLLFGGSGDNRLVGGAGRDRLESAEGRDSLYGGSGDDTLLAGDGDDQAWGEGGADVLQGGAGNDSLSGGTGLGDGADTLDGGLGDDRLSGGDGNDLLAGGDGQDVLAGENGADRLFGGAGNDSLSGGRGDDDLRGGGDSDMLQGGFGNDTLAGGDGSDGILGEVGQDLLSGGTGADTLDGGIGADTLYGGAGNDILAGGDGNDLLSGGLGADQFRHSGSSGEMGDLILDFSNAEGDSLWFGLADAQRQDFRVETLILDGVGQAGLAEVRVSLAATGQVIWTIADGAAQSAMLLHSSMNSFDLL